MRVLRFCTVALAAACASLGYGQTGGKCTALKQAFGPGNPVQIVKAEMVPPAGAGTVRPAPNFPATIPVALPAHCRVDGVIDQRTGAGGKQYGIRFALTLPENWNGRFLFQGGGGLNGNVGMPLGAAASGNNPALARGFAVVTTDTGHQGAVFDGSFFQDQQASLDFYYVANGRVAPLAKDLIARYYGRGPDHSYFAGCSTGGREGMIMSQRYPGYFDGIISGDPAMVTGHSNLALGYIEATFNDAAGRDASGKPLPLFSDSDKKLIMDSLMRACDDKDGLKDGMIFHFEACGFDPSTLACQGSKTESCLSTEQAAALKKAFAGPKDSYGHSVYPGFPYDAGIADMGGGIPGLLNGPRIPVPVQKPATGFDVDEQAARLTADANGRLGDATWTNLSSFSGHGGKLIFYHGLSDPWFSPLATLGYYQRMTKENGGMHQVETWSRIFLVPGMGHCQGGTQTLDEFDMLTAITDWVEKGQAPDSVVAKGRAFPGRSRPLCAYPKHAQYKGTGDPNDARNFSCQE